MANFLFLDIETTGLDSSVDQITEIAWISGETERQYFIEHDRLPNEWVLQKTDYAQRILWAPKIRLSSALNRLRADCEIGAIRSSGPTYLVGASPTFDDRFLRVAHTALGIEIPYHYHVIDVEVLAMGALGMAEPLRLRDLREAVGLPGRNEAPHTALADAREAALIFRTIMECNRRVNESVG